jgi:hypothetical protein
MFQPRGLSRLSYQNNGVCRTMSGEVAISLVGQRGAGLSISGYRNSLIGPLQSRGATLDWVPHLIGVEAAKLRTSL